MQGGSLRLVGAHEIRHLLGASRQRVYRLATRSDLPEPIAELAQGKVSMLPDIEAWIGIHRGAAGADRADRRDGAG